MRKVLKEILQSSRPQGEQAQEEPPSPTEATRADTTSEPPRLQRPRSANYGHRESTCYAQGKRNFP